VARIICFVLEAGTTTLRSRRRARSWQRLLLQRGLPALALIGAIGLVIGLVFAGSPSKLASGVRVAGVDVGA